MPVEPPRTTRGILLQLGPGLIIAGSIVGSGELIATTRTGAEAGFVLLWLILIGCLLKVFTQIEFGRYALSSGRTTLEGLNELPGPRWRVNWLVWYWLVMFLVSLGQLGGIVGGVGQALAIAQPLTDQGTRFNEYQDARARKEVLSALVARARTQGASDTAPGTGRLSEIRSQEAEVDERLRTLGEPGGSYDDIIWAAIITIPTSLILVWGRYSLIQGLSAVLVATFTFVTIGNLIHLQTLPDWRIGPSELLAGLSFRLPEVSSAGARPLATALAAMGIIGVGATELIQYPYWCLEKGYARWTGLRDLSEGWVRRARGWLKVLRWDAWVSAAIYTFATAAFYLLGASVLGRTGLEPEGTSMVRTLSEMYTPVFGSLSQMIFLFGAIAVLYSTFFVANAGHARVCGDAVRLFRGVPDGPKTQRWTRIFSGLFPPVCLLIYVGYRAPVKLVLASGIMQAIMLPMLAAAALYFRYRRTDRRIAPTGTWDVFLWLSAIGMFIAGTWAALSTLFPGLLSIR